MRDLDPQDVRFLEALYQYGHDRKRDSTREAVWKCYERLRGQLAMTLRNYGTLDDIELALQELEQQVELWRISHDPAYDVTLHGAANDNEK